jgi:hypothetical protein
MPLTAEQMTERRLRMNAAFDRFESQQRRWKAGEIGVVELLAARETRDRKLKQIERTWSR